VVWVAPQQSPYNKDNKNIQLALVGDKILIKNPLMRLMGSI